ncbi:hypothetical protein AAKU61_001422 [Undibacterium sp. GrIS 1.2]|uniref:TnsD family Tn7-like transposition protein n=1 Tax=Undibacterium sp. GrIS 1.2 TaxID=3143933 RepID=UPI003396B530
MPSSQSDLFPLAGIPNWLPNELLFSLGSRYHLYSANSRSSATCNQLFGAPRAGYQHDFPCRIEEFARRSGYSIGSAIEIIREHTILPFYLPFRPVSDQELAIFSMKSDTVQSLKYRLGILTSRFRANHPLKACTECIEADKKNHHISYWHLDHQYPGVWTCPTHRIPLLESLVKSNGVGRFLWYLPSEDILTSAFTFYTNDLVSQSLIEMRAFSEIVLAYSYLPAGFHFDAQRLLDTYHEGLKNHGLKKNSGQLNLVKIGRSYFQATSVLRATNLLIGFPENAHQAEMQMNRMLRLPRSGTHPLRHLLIAKWLFQDWDDFMRTYSKSTGQLQKAIFEFPATVSTETAQLIDIRREQFLSLLKTEKLSITKAAARVEIDTSTGMVWATKAGIEISRRPKILKEEIRKKLVADLRIGLEKQTVSEKYSISIQLVTTTLRTEVGLHLSWQVAQQTNRLMKHRAEWDALVNENRNSGLKIIRALAPATYAWLYRNDREWLRDKTSNLASALRGNYSSIDWDKRDQCLANEVRRIALALYDRHRSHKLHLWEIYQKLPELKAKLKSLNRLPLTKSAIEFALLGQTKKQNLDGGLF